MKIMRNLGILGVILALSVGVYAEDALNADQFTHVVGTQGIVATFSKSDNIPIYNLSYSMTNQPAAEIWRFLGFIIIYPTVDGWQTGYHYKSGSGNSCSILKGLSTTNTTANLDPQYVSGITFTNEVGVDGDSTSGSFIIVNTIDTSARLAFVTEVYTQKRNANGVLVGPAPWANWSAGQDAYDIIYGANARTFSVGMESGTLGCVLCVAVYKR